MTDVRPLLGAVLMLVACGPESFGPGGQAQSQARLGDGKLRLVSANLTTGNNQNYNGGEGMRILQALHADVAMLQEFNYSTNSSSVLRSFVDQTFGVDAVFVRDTRSLPNGIVSHFPIRESGHWTDPEVTNRAFTWARIDLPGERDLWAVSLHLLTRSATARNAEATALLAVLTPRIPQGDWVVLGGDFNTATRDEPALQTLSSLVVTSAAPPTDQAGDSDTNGPRSKPFDWVVVDPDLQAHAIPTVIGQSTFPTGLVVDTRVFAPIEDLAPALSSDSAAAGMQHMAVVRDFTLGGIAAPPTVHVLSPNGGEQFVTGAPVHVRWESSHVDTLDLEYAADGASFTPIATGLAASSGAFEWTAPAPTTTGVLRVRSSVDPALADTSDAAFSVVRPPRVIINEVLANEPGTVTGAEFVELYNAGESTADLSGWTLSDASLVRHVFAPGTTLAPRQTVVVFASASYATLSNSVAASRGDLSLNNGGDAVTVASADGTVVDTIRYGSALGARDGVSMNRAPDRTPDGALVLHSTLSSSSSSPGVSVLGEP